jgi:formate-dependent nitrite reductase membrane component NrfD
VVKHPVWTWEIPCYFYAGGLAGASGGLAFLSGMRGNRRLARTAWAVSLGGVTASPALLVSDLGRPARFVNMLRVFKPTSPMSMGSWLLVAASTSIGVAAVPAMAGPRGFRPLRRIGPLRALADSLEAPAVAARPTAALIGLPLATYTAALVADTAIPVWHEARQTLPAVFAAGSAASAGAAACVLLSPEHARPARRLGVAGGLAELVAVEVMERRLGDLGRPYHESQAGAFGRMAKALTAAGCGLLAAKGGRSRAAAGAGGLLITAGAICTRWSVYRAGFQSAARPADTERLQRDRMSAAGARARPPGAVRRGRVPAGG